MYKDKNGVGKEGSLREWQTKQKPSSFWQMTAEGDRQITLGKNPSVLVPQPRRFPQVALVGVVNSMFFKMGIF